eukprot:CAMPEP_0119053988 /NCGR_PEP_ID=MMETSP1177-20130426/74774_1 /TAXON_ID=2985 /ORGANISM="Ochromonas sp, Strain CCMP1899" /LENGTH=132 /DNA_ID=CAMNT_0007034083 /DNA_START=91 /DNA_END=486 /DNA_ORIENTATION=+
MTLNYTEKDVVTSCKDVWMNDNYCDVESSDMELYERFREAVLNDIDSSVVYGRQVMAEIEAVQRECRYGEYGRQYQYVDSTFEPSDDSLGQGQMGGLVMGWRCAPGINDASELISDYPDPYEIKTGIFSDNW